MNKLFIIGICLLALGLSLSVSAKEVPDAMGIWNFDSVSGDTVKDISGQGQDGTILGGGEIVAGKVGKAIKLNGSNQCVEVPDSDVLDVDDAQITMLCWYYWEGAGDGWQTFVSKGPMSGTNENYALFINTADLYFHFIITPNGGRININSPNKVIKTKEWQFVAGTYDGTTVKIYLDGEMIQQQAQAGNITPNKSALRIGHREAATHWWMGMLDEVGIFHRALEEGEINTIMKDGFKKFMAVEAEAKLPTVWGRIKSK